MAGSTVGRRVLWLLVFWVSACTGPMVEPDSQTYYVAPLVSYLRECPEYNCRVVGELYQGEAVTLLARRGEEWWQFYSPRTGLAGWLPASLVSRLPGPISPNYFIRENVTLRDCPGPDCRGHKQLARGEEVQKIGDNGKGWWRVLSTKDKAVGWVPAAQVAAAPATPMLAAPKYQPLFVAPPALKLHALPLEDSPVVKVIARNEAVEKVAAAGTRWLKVRHAKSSAEGWTRAGNLKETLVVTAEPPPRPKKAKKKSAVKKATEPAPPPEPEVKPEPM